MTFSPIDMVGNGLDFWNTMPTRLRTTRRVDTVCVEILAVKEHAAFDARVRRQLVHAVERADERRFSTAARPDYRCDGFGGHVQAHVVYRALRPVPH